MTTVTGILNDTGFSSTDGITSDQGVIITGTAVANGNVTVFLDGVDIGSTVASATGDWSLDHSAVSLAEGGHQVFAAASDSLGGFFPPTNTFDLTIDTTPIDLAYVIGSPSVDVRMPTLTLQQTVQAFGIFPTEGGSGNAYDAIGNIRTFGYQFDVNEQADGDELAIASNSALFSLVGTTYGGDGISSFGLPDLDGRLAVGVGTGPGLDPVAVGQQFGSDTSPLAEANLPGSVGGSDAAISNQEESQGIRYLIVTEGVYPSGVSSEPMIGQIMAVAASSVTPRGMVEAAGQLFPISTNPALFSILGTTYGGDGETTFALPDLRGRVPVGEGTGPGLPTVRLGEKIGDDDATLTVANLPLGVAGGNGQGIDSYQPGLGITFLVALNGVYPNPGSGTADYTNIGEIMMFAGNFAPTGYAEANGQLLPIAQNTALFSVFGTAYGGDGRTSFGLPDLRGRAVIGDGTDGGRVGTKAGEPETYLTADMVQDLVTPQVTAVTDDTGASPTDGITSDDTVVFSGTAGADDYVEVLVDGTSIGIALANASGAWTLDHSATPLAEGSYAVTARVVDIAGNVTAGTTSGAFTLVVDKTAPTISTAAAASILEGQTAVIDINSTDNNDSEGAGLTYAITGGTDAVAFDISATGELSFKAAPAYYAPTDSDGDNVYGAEVTVTDKAGNATVQTLAVTVDAVNLKPEITSSATASVAENQTAAIDVDATDPDGDPLVYAITGGTEAALFDIDAKTGVVTFKAAPDFENPGDSLNNNVYNIQVTATDDGKLADVQDIAITVTDVRGAPTITSAASASVAENQTAAIDVDATAVDGQPFLYAINGGADGGLFDIDAKSGVLTFRAAPDFETPQDNGADNVYDVQVVAYADAKLADVQDIKITVTNVNEAPSITTSATASVAENQTRALDINASDPDGENPLFLITGGADAGLFDLDAKSGLLTFKSAPDFENPGDAGGNNVYDIQVTAMDGGKLSDVQNIAITVTDVNEAPTITSASKASVLENQTAVIDVDATSASGLPLAYAISGGADAALFDIDGKSGVVSFKAAPDFETPSDAGGDNVYDIQVTATDTSKAQAVQSIAIIVGDVNEAPVITSSASANVAENQTAAIDVDVSDPEGVAPSFSIGGGADAALFDIDKSSGVVTFKAAPDFEAPGDAGGDNVYDIEVTALEGGGKQTDVQNIAITVTNVIEPAVDYPGTLGPDGFAGQDGNDTITGDNGNDTLVGNGGRDHISGGSNNDEIDGGDGDDTLRGDGGADILRGGAGNDTTNGGAGNDLIEGGDGDDTLYGGDGVGRDTLTGGTGADVFVVEGSAPNVDFITDFEKGIDSVDFSDLGISNATEFNAAVTVTDLGTDTELFFGFGHKLILQNYEFDINDFYSGAPAAPPSINQIGGSGDDSITGAQGNDTLGGGAGNGADTINGLGGDDLLRGGNGDDVLDGGADNDTVNGGNGNDVIYGGDGDDVLNGHSGADSIGAGSGADTLDGGVGNDSVNGGDGDDFIFGGRGVGRDTLTGGTGADVFEVFAGAHNIDTITDMETGVDKVDVTGFGFGDQATFEAAVTITDLGADLEIRFALGHKLILDNYDYDAADFVF